MTLKEWQLKLSAEWPKLVSMVKSSVEFPERARYTCPVEQRTPITSALDINALSNTVCQRNPYDHVIVPGFVKAEALPSINSAYPKIKKPGSYPHHILKFGPAFAALLEELQNAQMRQAVEKVFDIDLTNRPTTVTVRGQCHQKDGRIHTDSVEKIITVLVYINQYWQNAGGLLRILRDDNNIENYAAEIPPVGGTLIAFRRGNNSWHGHKRYVGERRVLQLNWVTDERFARREKGRHVFSAFLKRLKI